MEQSTHNGRPKSPLRRRREGQGLRQADVASKAGCSVPLISMTESGYVPRPELQEGIAAAVSASVGSFWP